MTLDFAVLKAARRGGVDFPAVPVHVFRARGLVDRRRYACVAIDGVAPKAVIGKD